MKQLTAQLINDWFRRDKMLMGQSAAARRTIPFREVFLRAIKIMKIQLARKCQVGDVSSQLLTASMPFLGEMEINY